MEDEALEARLYDWECELTLDRQQQDAPFFDQLLTAAGVQRILVLGCGTGRVAIRLVRPSRELLGVDISAARLALAERKSTALQGIKWRIGDMRRLRLRATWDAVVVPYSTFLLLRTDAERRAALESIRAALRPGGEVILDLSPNFPTKPETERMLLLQAPSTALGAQVSYWETLRQVPHRQATLIGRRYVLEGPQMTRRLSVVERWSTLRPDQVLSLCAAAGLNSIKSYGGYDARPLFLGAQVSLTAYKHIYVLKARPAS